MPDRLKALPDRLKAVPDRLKAVPDRRKATERTVPTLAASVIAFVALFAAACTNAPEATPNSGEATPTATSPGSGGDANADALYYYPPVEGATLRLTNSGAVSSTSDVTVNTVTSGPDGQTVAVTEVISGSGEPITVERTFHTSQAGGLSIDAAAFGASAPGFTVTATGDDIVIPPIAELESGSTPSGETFVELSGSGVTMRNDVTYTVAGDGVESVTVPVGTVEAYVVKITLNITSSVAGQVTGTARYWFVPGFGLVRQETTITGMTGTSELVSSSVPLP